MYELLEKPLIFENIIIHHQSYRRAVLDALHGARASIRIAAYIVNFNFKRPAHPVNDIIRTVLLKQRKNIEIFFLLDGEKKGAANRRPAMIFEGFLKNKGIKCAVQMGKPTMHMKMILIDRERIFLGSHNLTGSSVRSPLESTVEIFSEEIGRVLSIQFDQIFGAISHG